MPGNTKSQVSREVSPDRWARWVLERRFGGNEQARRKTDAFLAPIRARIMALAEVRPGDTVLDIASRDGYLGLAALESVGDTGTVVFTERSAELLEACRKNVQDAGLAHRAEFLRLQPDDLSPVGSGEVDVVLMRSILNYVPDRQRALREYHRVLLPGGRLSFIQMFPGPVVPGRLLGYRTEGVDHLAARVRDVLLAHRPDTYADWDERQLLTWVEAAGFRTISMLHETEISDTSDWPLPVWDEARKIAAGPDQPTLQEAIDEALTPAEAAELIAVLRVEVEAGRRAVRFPRTYVRAVRSQPDEDGAGSR
ncbi:methyltransferase domain-containing protein [Streptomyces sp. B6B3]|uniref:class I SAM-dependent methyltransferase n=1 Tax=Streptomyces sp. B6B3 TaxID=3153570 RepID=UPI00325D7CE1